MNFSESCFSSPERERERESHSLLHFVAHTLEWQDCGSSHWAEDLGCTRPP